MGDIVPTSSYLQSPKCALISPRSTIFVSDQVSDGVFEYSSSGAYIATITSLATSGIDNVRGIRIYNDLLYVTVYQGTYANTVQRFDCNGAGQMTWASANDPFDLIFRSGDALVTSFGSHKVEQYSLTGTYLGTLISGINYPQQIIERANGNLYVAGTITNQGIYEYTDTGTQLNYYPISQGTLRGVYELGNGKLLVSTSDSVGTYDTSTYQFQVVYSGGNFQFINLFGAGANSPPYEPSDPDPADGAVNITVDSSLSWVGGDPDGNPVTYDVYLGTTSPPGKIASNVTNTTYQPASLAYDTTYYWKIVAWDNHYVSTAGPIWQFTTVEELAPVLEVSFIPGSVGVTVQVKNNGTAAATNVSVAFTVDGGLIIIPGGGHKQVEVGFLEPGKTGTAKLLLVGLGKPTITAQASCSEGATAEASHTVRFLFLIFVIY